MKYLLILFILLGAGAYCWQSDIRSFDDLKSHFAKSEDAEVPSAPATYYDAETAFRQDQLFAVLSKEVIAAETFDKTFQKTKLGGQVKGTYPPVYFLRCMGRETRETYIFVVDEKLYDEAFKHQKLQPRQLGTFKKYLSEERFRDDLFHERFRFQMIN